MNTQVENFIHPKVGEGQVDIDLVYNIIRHRLDREVSVEIIEDIRESPGYKAAQKKAEAPGTIDNKAMIQLLCDCRDIIGRMHGVNATNKAIFLHKTLKETIAQQNQ